MTTLLLDRPTTQVSDEISKKSRENYARIVGAGVAGVATTALVSESAFAQAAPDPATQINSAIASLQAIAGAVIGIGLGVMVFRVGVKLLNRATVKG